ncbi:MAG: cupin domain-containing protein [Bacteroidota bacterium]
MTIEYLVNKLKLLPHPEGGYYKETYRSEQLVAQNSLPGSFGGERNIATAIYFLIENNNFSALHKIKSDETWHFYYGDALEVIEIDNNGKLTSTLVGNNLLDGESFQYTVKANTWFGSRVRSGGNFSLVGCSVSPGFDFKDFELAKKDELLLLFPEHKSIINEMTRI